MDVAVVYESHYGQTRRIAEAIAAGARDAGAEARAVALEEATVELLDTLDLLVLGAPTHSLGMSRPWTRVKTGAGRERAEGAIIEGVRDWLTDLAHTEGEPLAAAFDTRLPAPFAGGAVRGIVKGLERRGYTVVDEGHGFVVEAAEGPLRAGEEERAYAWGGALVRTAGAARDRGR